MVNIYVSDSTTILVYYSLQNLFCYADRPHCRCFPLHFLPNPMSERIKKQNMYIVILEMPFAAMVVAGLMPVVSIK